MKTIKAAVIGGAGFAGIECVRLLMQHPDFELVCVTSDANAGRPIADLYPAFKGRTDLAFSANDDPLVPECDVAFLAVPHTGALEHAPALVEKGVAVIDLSADFRLRDAAVYEEYYNVEHTAPDLLATAVFGQPELFRAELESAHERHERQMGVLVACAGCYPTATSLAAAPAVRANIVKPNTPVIVDAISGITGAGKKASERTHFCFADENVEAYGLVNHRHTPEIEQILGLEGRVCFTPHLAPLKRGLLSTVTLQLAGSCDGAASLDGGKTSPNGAGPINLADPDEIYRLYKEFYEGTAFVEVLPQGEQPKTSSVAGSNFAHIGIAVNERLGLLVATCAIDNLCKGAAGQAVQCANIVFGLPEDAGLTSLALPV